MRARDLAIGGAAGAGIGAALAYLLTRVRPPDDHSRLMENIVFFPPMPEAEVRTIPVYTGMESFKSNPKPTPHSGWLIVEELKEKNVYQAMAFADIWTISTGSPRIYTLEIAKLERISISFRVFDRMFSIAESATYDVSGKSPGYWLAQVKETGELGEFL